MPQGPKLPHPGIVPFKSRVMDNHGRSEYSAEMQHLQPNTTRVMAEDSQTLSSVTSRPPNNHADPKPPLPSGWEELLTGDGKVYYANHVTKRTTWRKPEAQAEGNGENIHTGLPVAWEALVDDEGRTYYADHATRSTTYDKPESPQDELPAGWEVLRTPQGVAYYADHNTHTTTWDDPRHTQR